MPYYICRLAAEDGLLSSRSVLAGSTDECRKLFESDGYYVLSVSRDWKKSRFQSIRFGKMIKDRDFIMFNQELKALIKSGYPILKSLEVIGGRIKNIHLKELLSRVESDVRSGKALSEAFAAHEDRFGKVYTASLMAGERSGNLVGTLGRYIDYAKVIAQTKSKIKSAMVYPTLLLAFSFVLMNILVYFILPKFSQFYQDFEAQLPAITRFLISFALGTRKYWYLVLFPVLILIAGFLVLRKRPDVQLRIDTFKMRIPFGRGIWLESGVSLFGRTLGLLLEAGISLISAIGIACQAIPNRFLVSLMKDVPDRIKNGESLSESLSKASFFPPLALDMIKIGEASANLQGMLAEVADFYDERIRAKIGTLVSLIEPLVIIFMGLIVAGMLLSIYLPIFNIIRVAR
ncbi:MAG: type II secretion system F family protein [Acidobacteriota bacterium]|nr:type II secretion system F family protein [Acidobacteriota bacterium]